MTGKDIIKVTLNLVIVYLIGGLILAFVFAKAHRKYIRTTKRLKKGFKRAYA